MRLLLLGLLGATATAAVFWRVLAMDLSTASIPKTEAVTEDRVAAARARHGKDVNYLCAVAGLPYPPRQLFLRAFKSEGEIEAWGSSGNGAAMKLIATFAVTAKSGKPGPKRREGDLQVPEGCYRVVVFNPKSSFHLSLGLDYPNAADRMHVDPEKPGCDIYIHGGRASIGCLPIGDNKIEELYLLATDAYATHKAEISVHVFPIRMQGPTWTEFRAQHPEHQAFWSELEPIYQAFESTHCVPNVKVSKAGQYKLENGGRHGTP
jgi:murein L,D-transpeptidase YafK